MNNQDWVEVELGDLLQLRNGYAFKSKNYQEKGIPVIRIGDIGENGLVSIDHAKKITQREEFEGHVVKKGDILLAMSGATTGKFGIYNNSEKAYQNQRVGNLIPHSKHLIEKKFIYYLMYSLKNKILKRAHGGAQPNISGKKIYTLKTKLFALPIQRAIVSKLETALSQLESGINSFKQAQQKLDLYRQAVLKKAFEGGFTEGVSLKWGTLNDKIVDTEYGTSKKSLKSGKVPVLRMGNMQNGRITWENLKFSSDSDEISKYLLKRGDVLFNRTNSPEIVGKTAIYKEKRKSIFAGYLIRINYNREILIGDYLNYYLNSFHAKIHGNKVKTDGVNQSNINATKLKKYPFPICDLEEQKAIVAEIESRLSVADQLQKDIETNLQKAQALRQSILKKAFEGRLLTQQEIEACKQEEDYMPAEELLKKIKEEQ